MSFEVCLICDGCASILDAWSGPVVEARRKLERDLRANEGRVAKLSDPPQTVHLCAACTDQHRERRAAGRPVGVALERLP